ncbi:hypothetical protein WMR74_001654 [Providencia rettgeri]
MKRFMLITSIVLSTVSIKSHAALYKNCSSSKDKSGYIKSISVGVDNGEDANVSITLQINSTDTTPISVYRKINDENGKAMFDLLLSSYTKENSITITRCVDDQIAGVTSTIRY